MIWILQKNVAIIDGAKIETGRLVPFMWNMMQRHLYPRLAAKNRLLKMRQGGATTFFLLVRLLLPIVTEGGKTGLLISQKERYAREHFRIARRAYNLIGAEDPQDNTKNAFCIALKQNLLHTAYSSSRELIFDQIDSKLIIESAENEEAAQGITLHHVVASEVARWRFDPEATVSNIKGALVSDGTFDEETTGNGAAGYFYEKYLLTMNSDRAGDAKAHFYEWYWGEDYEVGYLTPAQEQEMLEDLTADELSVIRKIHKDLAQAA